MFVLNQWRFAEFRHVGLKHDDEIGSTYAKSIQLTSYLKSSILACIPKSSCACRQKCFKLFEQNHLEANFEQKSAEEPVEEIHPGRFEI